MFDTAYGYNSSHAYIVLLAFGEVRNLLAQYSVLCDPCALDTGKLTGCRVLN